MNPAHRAGARGSATLAMLAVVALVGLLLGGLARTADAAHRRARVDAVADLTALAAATAGRPAAAGAASANGARLATVEDRPDGAVEVAVTGWGVQAVAAARAVPAGDGARDRPPSRR